MSSDWPVLPLEQCLDALIDYRGKTPEKTEFGVPLVTAKVIKGGRIEKPTEFIATEAYESWMRRGIPRAGDVVLTTEAPLGEVAQLGNERVALAQRVVTLRGKAGLLDNAYLRYLLQTEEMQSQLAARATGTTVLGIKQSELRKVLVQLPPIEMQRSAASLLASLDDRIALLRETNAILETIAQALFKSWFVDFNPVRAKQQGLSPVGMDDATAALFPDSLEESALGLVPKGWKVCALDEIATYLNGLALQKFPPSDDSWLPVIKIAQLRKGDSVGADRAGRHLKPEYVIQNGDVLFSWSGSLEVEVWCGGEGALNQHLFKVTSKAFPKWFYLRWTRHHLSHFRQIAVSKATTMGHIQRAHLSEAKVLVPPDALRGAMDDCFGPLLARSVENELQAQTLATLRDTLLPRLISGQIRLAPAQEAIAEATHAD
jgi:type I restriction enzyme, S subunit